MSGLNFILGQLSFSPQGDVCMGTGYMETVGFPDSNVFPIHETLCRIPYSENAARVLVHP